MMKRHFGLSALLVGLSISVASAAGAAEGDDHEASSAQPAPSVAPATSADDVQQPSDQGTPPTTGAAPAAAPAVSVGTGGISTGGKAPAPAADKPQEPPAEAHKPKARPLAGTQLFLTQTMSTSTVFRGQQQYANPTTDTNLWLLPRYNLSDTFQLRARAIFTYEWTNSDATVTQNEPRFSDTTVQLFYKKIPKVVGFKPMAAVNVGIPTSPESRARTMYFAPGATLQVSRFFEHVLGGDFGIIAFTSYSHPVYQYTTPGVRGDVPYDFQCLGGVQCRSQLSGAMNPSDSIAYALILEQTWGKWTPALYYLGGHAFTYTPKSTNVNGDPVEAPPGFDRSTVRNSTFFSAWLDYEANGWLTVEAGYTMGRSLLTANGKYGNPFFDRYQDMRVYLGANINLDNLEKAIEGVEAEAGVVRAKNRTGPALGAY